MTAEAWTFAGIAVTALCGLLAAVLVEAVRSRRRGDKAAKQATEAAEELKPNGGKSTRDAVDRIEAAVDRIEQRTQDQGERLARLEGLAEAYARQT